MYVYICIYVCIAYICIYVCMYADRAKRLVSMMQAFFASPATAEIGAGKSQTFEITFNPKQSRSGWCMYVCMYVCIVCIYVLYACVTYVHIMYVCICLCICIFVCLGVCVCMHA